MPSIHRDTDGGCPMLYFSKMATCFPPCCQGQCQAMGQNLCQHSQSINQHWEPLESRWDGTALPRSWKKSREKQEASGKGVETHQCWEISGSVCTLP